jgi:hypothetical protein
LAGAHMAGRRPRKRVWFWARRSQKRDGCWSWWLRKRVWWCRGGAAGAGNGVAHEEADGHGDGAVIVRMQVLLFTCKWSILWAVLIPVKPVA